MTDLQFHQATAVKSVHSRGSTVGPAGGVTPAKDLRNWTEPEQAKAIVCHVSVIKSWTEPDRAEQSQLKATMIMMSGRFSTAGRNIRICPNPVTVPYDEAERLR